MFQDQSTDFDNRVKGIEFKYMPYDIMEIFYVSGSGEYGTKSIGTSRDNDLIFNHELDCYGAQFYTGFGDINVSYSEKKTQYKAGLLNDVNINGPFLGADTRLAVDLSNFRTDIGQSVFDSLAANFDSEVKLTSLNLAYSNTLSIFDIYYEKSINSYNKILRENDLNSSDLGLKVGKGGNAKSREEKAREKRLKKAAKDAGAKYIKS